MFPQMYEKPFMLRISYLRAMQSAETILVEHKLRITQSRLAVIKVLIDTPHAMSQPDLEKALDNTCDRVTIYRTLDAFLKNGILHKVPDMDGTQKYALCDSCNDHQHHDEHMHFKCSHCGNTECLNEVPMPEIKLPKGYLVEDWNLLLLGKCNNCN